MSGERNTKNGTAEKKGKRKMTIFTRTFETKKAARAYKNGLLDNNLKVIFEGTYCITLKNEKTGSVHEIYCKENLR